MVKRIYKTGVAHPAVYSDNILPAIAELLEPKHVKILDGFAGTGRIHELSEHVDWWINTIGVEIEPEWATLHSQTVVGNALDLPFSDEFFDAYVTSPCYGNRFADAHVARDDSERRSYTHDIGRTLHDDNAGKMHWGQEYRDLHTAAWCEAIRVLKPGGRFVLNISDHIRGGERQHVSSWHTSCLIRLGLDLVDVNRVMTRRMRRGSNHNARVASELVLAFDKPRED